MYTPIIYCQPCAQEAMLTMKRGLILRTRALQLLLTTAARLHGVHALQLVPAGAQQVTQRRACSGHAAAS